MDKTYNIAILLTRGRPVILTFSDEVQREEILKELRKRDNEIELDGDNAGVEFNTDDIVKIITTHGNPKDILI